MSENALDDTSLKKMERFKGQVFALENILDIENFLNELIDEEKPKDEEPVSISE